MPRYLIERNIPGAGSMSQADLQGASAKSCQVINDMPVSINWIQSYVIDDRIICIYDAKDEDTIREHAEKSGFPANTISEVKTIIDPTWASPDAMG